MKRQIDSAVTTDRIPFVAALFILLTFTIFTRLYYLQVICHNSYEKTATSQYATEGTIAADRGQIFATDSITGGSSLLAGNETLDMLYINPKQIIDKETAIASLSTILAIEKTELAPKFEEDSGYVIIKHKLTEEQSVAVEKANITGVFLEEETWRFYPEGVLASSLLGFVNTEGDGNYGIEQYCNELLSGIDGYLNAETDTSGITIAFGEDASVAAVDGSDVYLTVDRYIQGKAEELLNEAVEKYSADGGAVIVVDKTTGAVLAMANNPSFNPNEYDKVTDYSVFQNDSVNSLYEPGSVFKAITLAAGLDSNLIEPDSTYTDTGSVTLNGYTIRNSDLKSHGLSTMTYVLEQSLNTGTTYIEQLLGKSSFYNYVKKFGFGTKTGIEINGEAGGTVYEPDDLNEHGYATMSFGQSISVTPLQMIMSYAAIANDGLLVKPHLIGKTVDSAGNTTEVETTEVSQVISSENASQLTDMLISVVENGHGKQAQVAGYKIAGKTGTAQVVKEDGTGYYSNKNIGTFVGYPVAEDANFVVLAKIDNPQGVAWAESTAAPVVGDMIEFLLSYYQIPPTEVE